MYRINKNGIIKMKLTAKFDKSTRNYVKIALVGLDDKGIIGSKDSPCIYLRPDTLKSIPWLIFSLNLSRPTRDKYIKVTVSKIIYVF